MVAVALLVGLGCLWAIWRARCTLEESLAVVVGAVFVMALLVLP